MSSYQHRKSHCVYKTILGPYYLHNGNSCTGNRLVLKLECSGITINQIAADALVPSVARSSVAMVSTIHINGSLSLIKIFHIQPPFPCWEIIYIYIHAYSSVPKIQWFIVSLNVREENEYNISQQRNFVQSGRTVLVLCFALSCNTIVELLFLKFTSPND